MLPLEVVVLTFNEEANLAACLDSLAEWARCTVVVVSGSTDRTLEIARVHGVRVLCHPFETHASQWRWALGQAGLSRDWVLGLDADQRLTPALREEIARELDGRSRGDGGPAGYFVKRRQIFRGRWIRHGGYYPKYLLKLFRRDRVWLDEADLVDHHFYVDGPVAKLRGDLIEDNRNEYDISVWIEKHNRYALRQAREEWENRSRKTLQGSFWSHPDVRVQKLKQVWAWLPLFVRPGLYFLYRYVVRLGFLDGRQGFIFHFLQGFWYRLLVDIHLADLRSRPALDLPNRVRRGFSGDLESSPVRPREQAQSGRPGTLSEVGPGSERLDS